MAFKAGASRPDPAWSTDCCADGALATADARRNPNKRCKGRVTFLPPVTTHPHPPACARARRRNNGARARTCGGTRCSYSTRARAISPPRRLPRSRSRRPAAIESSWYSLISDTSSRAYRRAPATSSASSLSHARCGRFRRGRRDGERPGDLEGRHRFDATRGVPRQDLECSGVQTGFGIRRIPASA